VEELSQELGSAITRPPLEEVSLVQGLEQKAQLATTSLAQVLDTFRLKIQTFFTSLQKQKSVFS